MNMDDSLCNCTTRKIIAYLHILGLITAISWLATSKFIFKNNKLLGIPRGITFWIAPTILLGTTLYEILELKKFKDQTNPQKIIPPLDKTEYWYR